MKRNKFFLIYAVIGSFLLHHVLGQACDNYWLLDKNSCFRYFGYQADYTEAEEQCNSRGAQLPTNITDRVENLLLGPQIQSKNSSYWCQTESTESDLEDYLAPSILHILQRRRRSAPCCIIRNKMHGMGECGNKLNGFICEKDSTPTDHRCSQNGTSEAMYSDWDTARKSCQCKGGDLYSFKDHSDEDNFFEFAREWNQSMWIGLRRDADSEAFQWSDGTALTHSVLDHGRLITDDNSTLCVAYITKDEIFEATDCNSALIFLCKYREDYENLTTATLAEDTYTEIDYENLTTATSAEDTYTEIDYQNRTTATSDEDTYTEKDTGNLTTADTYTETDTENLTFADTDTGTDTENLTFANTYTETDTENLTFADTYTETDTENVTIADTYTETDTGNLTIADTYTETDTGNLTIADTYTETDSENLTTVDTYTEKDLGNISTWKTTLDTSTHTEYTSPCSPIFEDCYLAAIVIIIIIVITALIATAVGVIVTKFLKRKGKNDEQAVQLLNIHSYDDGIPVKLLSLKIKEVIA